MKAAVVGAGWAGLSAALGLHRQGWEVTIFEAAPAIGGRARSVSSAKLGVELDNGQHILISAYAETLALLRSLHGGNLDTRCATLPLAWESADGSFSLRVPAGLPSRLALGWGLLQAQGLGWQARWRAAQALTRLALARWQAPPGQTVEQWLNHTRQPATLRERFWRPLCLATMNTPAHAACAQLFAHVLRDSLGQGAQACRIVLPSVTLGELWESSELRRLDIRLRSPVRELRLAPNVSTAQYAPMPAPTNAGDKQPPCPAIPHQSESPHGGQPKVYVDGEPFDAVIVATPSAVAHRLLQGLPPCPAGHAYLAPFASLTPLPIATLYLRLAARWRLPRPMLLLRDAPEQGQYGQWVFDRAAFMRGDDTPVLSIVISDAGALADCGETAVVEGVLAQLRAQLERAGPMPAVLGHQLIVEKRATFAALPGLPRPQQETPWPGVFVAGDWTDTGYPAVLEGAVRSGLAAAQALDSDIPGSQQGKAQRHRNPE